MRKGRKPKKKVSWSKKTVSFNPDIEKQLKKRDGLFSCCCRQIKTDKEKEYRVSSVTLKISDPQIQQEFNDHLRKEGKTRGLALFFTLFFTLLVLAVILITKVV